MHQASAQAGTDTLSASSTISILTIMPGDEIYSMFGHTAIRVRDPEQGIDHTYNFGTFTFDNPLIFGARFAYGKLDYFLSDTGFDSMLRFYRDVAERPIIEQRLNLTIEQRVSVLRFLEWNVQPENRAYRYDFLFDNCSTRVRDVFYDHLRGLEFSTTAGAGTTFRRLLDPYAADKRFLDLGWDLLLGAPVDREAQAWETMFLPLYLLQAADSARFTGEAGSEPFVASKDTLFWVAGRDLPEPSAPWASILLWAVFLLGFGITAAARLGASEAFGRWLDAILFGAVGFAGILMLLMWSVSLHQVTIHNWNLLWAWPTHAAAAWFMGRGHVPQWLRRYLAITSVVAMTVMLGWTLWPQELHVATIPVVLLLALRSAWRAFPMGERPARRSLAAVNL